MPTSFPLLFGNIFYTLASVPISVTGFGWIYLHYYRFSTRILDA